MMKVPNDLLARIKKERVFFLATHVNPDGDALGSSLALADVLRSLGKKVYQYNRDAVPGFYHFMPGWRSIRSSSGRALNEHTYLILLDCNSPDRAALEGKSFSGSAVIDHHITESSFGEIRWIERHAAATGLMVMELIKALKVPITKTIATNLYTALAVDTGIFRYSNTDENVLLAAAELVKAGAAPGLIAEKLHEQWTDGRFDLLNLALKTVHKEEGIAVMYVTKKMMRQTDTVESDTENFANFPRMIGSIKISALIRESEGGKLKVSMRSKGNVDVSKIAARMGGGGHKNAAGFRIASDINSVKKLIFEAGRKLLNNN